MNLKELNDSLQDVVREQRMKMAKGKFLIPGQVITIHGAELIIIKHIDEMPVGHYLASPDLSDFTTMAQAIPTVVFHPPTKKWASSTSLPDLLKAAKDQAKKAGPEFHDLLDQLKSQTKGNL